jgi:hypothetical protein
LTHPEWLGLRRAAFRRDADDAARDQQPLRVWKLRPHRHRVGGVGDLYVEEVAHARHLIQAAVRQLDVYGEVRAALSCDPALVGDDASLARLK